jgi:hypothetical protein
MTKYCWTKGGAVIQAGRKMEITGDHGELIDRLLTVIADHDDWSKLGFLVASATGSHELQRVFAEAGDDPSGISRRAHRGKAECLKLLRRRLLSLVDDGVKEDFLARSLRDHMSHSLGQFTDRDEVKARFSERRRWLVQAADDPEMAKRVNRDDALDLVAETSGPSIAASLGTDEIERHQAKKAAWDRDAEQALSDRAIDVWWYANSTQRTAQIRRRLR